MTKRFFSGFILVVLTFSSHSLGLSSPPGIEPGEQKNIPEVHQVPVKQPKEIKVSTIKFTGLPEGTELTVSTIEFDGLEPGAELTVSTIEYSGKTIIPESEPGSQFSVLPAPSQSVSLSQTLGMEPPECGSPRIQILSPKDKQVIEGDLVLQLGLFCTSGSPQVHLDWIWYPESVPGQWPDTSLQQSILLIPVLSGQYEVTIPHSQFPQEGNYHIRATMKTGPNQQNSDKKRFVVLANKIKSHAETQKNRLEQRNKPKHEIINYSPPRIIQPTENKRITKIQRVRVHADVPPGLDKITHQLEWKSFNSRLFHRAKGSSFTYKPQKGGQTIVGFIHVRQKGVYRIRLKSGQTGSIWSPWRTFSVGSEQKSTLKMMRTRITESEKKQRTIRKPKTKAKKLSTTSANRNNLKQKKKIIPSPPSVFKTQ